MATGGQHGGTITVFGELGTVSGGSYWGDPVLFHTYRMKKVSRPNEHPPPPTPKNPLELRDLRWPDVPLDIYRLVVEQCPVRTLYNMCLVSRLSREFATPTLYRSVYLHLGNMGGKAVLACLRHLVISTSAKYCEELRFDVGRDWRSEEFGEPPENELLLDSAIMRLVEFAIAKMPNLKTFRCKGMIFPDNPLMRALQDRPNLANMRLTGDGWVILEQLKLKIGAFAHLKSLRVKGICSAEMVHEVRHVIEHSPGLEILHLACSDDFVELEPEFSLFDFLFGPRLGAKGELGSGEGRAPPGRSLKQLSIVDFVENGPPQAAEGVSFSDIAPSQFGHLDCLTLYGIDDPLLEDIGSCTGLRLRKLRVRCVSWLPLTDLLSCSELELLRIELQRPGFYYDSLIPLVCKSKEKLRELRLEWSDSVAQSADEEALSEAMAYELVEKCLHLQHLGLRADFGPGVWARFRNQVALSLPDLVSFRLQRTPTSLPTLPPPHALLNYRPGRVYGGESISVGVGTVGGGSDGGAGDGGGGAVLPLAMIPSIFFSDMRPHVFAGEGVKKDDSLRHPEWEGAQEFATAFVRAAKAVAFGRGKSIADKDIRINLKYVGIDGKYSEIWMMGNEYVISDLNDHKRVFNRDRDRLGKAKYGTLFRISQTD